MQVAAQRQMIAVDRQTQTCFEYRVATREVGASLEEWCDVQPAETEGAEQSRLFCQQEWRQQIARTARHAHDVRLDGFRAETVEDRCDGAECLNDFDCVG